jgi:c(7)-type cytochrome triheme protein
MRWGVAVVLASVAAAAVPAAMARPKSPNCRDSRIALCLDNRRFDHAAHNRAQQAKTGKVEPCGGVCHRGEFSGGERKRLSKREHERCYEKCHQGTSGKWNYTEDCSMRARGEGRLCIVCHEHKPEQCLPPGVWVADDQRGVSFAARYPHRRHVQPGAASSRQCEPCHGSFGERKGASLAVGHSMCADCHGKTFDPAMDKCDSCHIDATSEAGKHPVVSRGGPNPFAVTGAFQHEPHARYMAGDGKACLACHANIATAERDDVVPLPTMQSCYQQCHNGAKAFSAVGTTCTRCHAGGRK